MGRRRNKKCVKEKDEGKDVNAAEVAMEKAVGRVQEILREHSEEEIRATLLQCNLNHNVAIDRLLSLQDASNEQGASTRLPDSSTTTSSTLVPNQSGLPNVPVISGEAVPLSPEPSSSAITNGETRSAPISSSEAAPSLLVPSSCAITNGVTRSVPMSSNVEVLPSSRPLTNVTPMAEVLRDLHVPSKQNESPLLHQKPDATNPVFNSSFPVSESLATRQSIATASSLGPRPPTSMADAFGTYPRSEPHINNQQVMNRGQIPSGQYGNMINSSYWRRNQNESYNMAPSAAPVQRRGVSSNSYTSAHLGGNMRSSHYTWIEPDDTSIYQSLDSVFAPYRNSTLSLSATSSVHSSHDSAYGAGMLSGNSRLGYEDVSRDHLPSNSSGASSVHSFHGSGYGFDMTSGNDENSRLGYEDVSSNHLPSYSSGTSLIGPSSHGSDYVFDMTSGNAANSRLGYEDASRIHLPSNSSGPSSHVNGSNSRLGYGDYLPPVHQQGTSPFVWRAQGKDSYRSLPSYRLQGREAYFERNRAYLASLEQRYNRNDPSDQTKQRPRDK